MGTNGKLAFVCALTSTMSAPSNSQPLRAANATDPAVARTSPRTGAAHYSDAALSPQDNASAPLAPLRADVFVWSTT
jgi:hypothetical protein